MSQTVAANAGPLMALAKINLLHLLKQLYGRVHFPAAVYEGTVVEGTRQGFEDAHTLRLFLNQEGWELTSCDCILLRWRGEWISGSAQRFLIAYCKRCLGLQAGRRKMRTGQRAADRARTPL